MFAINIISVIFLLASFVAPYISADKFPVFSIIAMLTPFWFTMNFAFVFYWFFFDKRRSILSIMVLVLSGFFISLPFRFSAKNKNYSSDDIKIMTFNTRNFNKNEELKIEGIDSLIINFVTKQDPDIVSFQEFHYAMKRSDKLLQYPYKFIDFIYGEHTGRVIQAIYSKYPILEAKPIEFPKSSNSAIYADILMKNDTIRVYNVHLQSFSIVPEVNTIKNQDSKQLFGRVNKVLKLQKQQVDILKNHMKQSPYKTIVLGDLNNTQYTNIYKSMKGDLQDSFIEAGSGFGKTFNLKGFPKRIDYIMADANFEFTSHTNYDVKLSDHYPVMATLKLKTDEATVD